MERIAVVSGADRGLGFALCSRLLDAGWRVFAGQYMPDWPFLSELQPRFPDRLSVVPLDVADELSTRAAAAVVGESVDHIDLLINNAGVTTRTGERKISEQQDYAEAHRLFDVNSLGPVRMCEAFMGLLSAGDMKRICFISSEAGSINCATRTSWYAYCMSKSALNMAAKIMHNDLRSSGYTLRVYHPGWMRTWMSGTKGEAATYEPEEAAVPALSYFLADLVDEDRLVLRDINGKEWPW